MSKLFHGMSYAAPGSLERAIYDRAIPWTIAHIPHMLRAGIRDFGPCVVFVVTSEDAKARILASVVFHNHQAPFRLVEVSMASVTPLWARPKHISTMLSYVFDQVGCGRLQAIVPKRGSGPKHTQKFLRHLGFKFEGCGRKGFGNDDALMFSMLREDASRWLGPPRVLEMEAA